jgi:hypothetical protein
MRWYQRVLWRTGFWEPLDGGFTEEQPEAGHDLVWPWRHPFDTAELRRRRGALTPEETKAPMRSIARLRGHEADIQKDELQATYPVDQMPFLRRCARHNWS